MNWAAHYPPHKIVTENNRLLVRCPCGFQCYGMGAYRDHVSHLMPKHEEPKVVNTKQRTKRSRLP